MIHTDLLNPIGGCDTHTRSGGALGLGEIIQIGGLKLQMRPFEDVDRGMSHPPIPSESGLH